MGGAAGAGGADQVQPQPLLDDFDDGDAELPPFEGRSGAWYPFNDTTGVQNAFTVGNATSNPTPSVHVVGQGFTSWGAGIGVNLKEVSGQRELYDVTRYRGITFRAKIAAGTQSSLRVLVITKYSAPQYGLCGSAPGKACGDHLYCIISPLKTTWTKHECSFEALKQDGNGLPQVSLEAESVLGIQLRFGTENATIDSWIDDIAFMQVTP